MKTKYIVGEITDVYGSELTALVFGENVTHSTFANKFTSIFGAGFCFINSDRKSVAYGESVSLNVKSREDEDSIIIDIALGLTE
jgi:hypothetical protein